MKRVVVVPITDVAHFPDLEVIARVGRLAALVGPTSPGRMRDAFDSEEDFLRAVARGFADLYSFPTLRDAAKFAEQKLADLAGKAAEIEKTIAVRQRHAPMPTHGTLISKDQKPA